jgi:hypothetical protein
MTHRKGFFSRFRNIVLGIAVLGILLFWQAILDGNIIQEMADAGVDPSEIGISFSNLAFFIYFLGIALIGFVIFRNRQYIKNWFPARK